MTTAFVPSKAKKQSQMGTTHGYFPGVRTFPAPRANSPKKAKGVPDAYKQNKQGTQKYPLVQPKRNSFPAGS